MPDPVLVTCLHLSARFPLPNHSDQAWAELLRRFRSRGELKDKKHYILKYYPQHRYLYNLRTVIQLLCQKARADRPLPSAVYLTETFYDDFCCILAGGMPHNTPNPPKVRLPKPPK